MKLLEGHSLAPTTREASTIRHDVADAIDRSCEWFSARQATEGYWCGELEGDTILESEYILLLAFLGQADSLPARQAANYLLSQQLPSGGWAMYPGGKSEISGSVKAYFALKLTGHDPEAPYMRRARQCIRAHGGADAVNSFTRFYLALLGQISYDHCPAVPPELVLLPSWSPINIYRMSAWSRTIVVPLSIMWAHRPAVNIKPEHGIRELFLRDPDQWPTLRCPGLDRQRGFFSWDNFFRTADRWIKRAERAGVKPLRKRALKTAEKWMTDRFVQSDGLGAIFPPIIWSLIALKCLGYADDSPEVQYNHRELEKLTIVSGDTLRLEPCKSPVWDTAIVLRALDAAGTPANDEQVTRAVDWLLSKEVRKPGDWSHTVKAAPGGWYFEHNNEFYPDVDDTIMVLMALRSQFEAAQPGETPQAILSTTTTRENSKGELQRIDQLASACERATQWLLAMQNRDGGWGAFDKDNDHEFLCHVPFADHNAMIDPSTPDIAGRVLEALGQWGYRVGHPAVDRAVKYIRQQQETDGSWFGRWGVNYIYGTWQCLVGLTAVGISPHDPAVRRGASWLLAMQQASGAWGESADSYEEPLTRGRGPATASQTAWAILGLIAAGHALHPATERGIHWLTRTQVADGSWEEPYFTGTGFPRVFYLRYHYYPQYFPLLALGQFAQHKAA
ncbi:MAG TPA: terpene cyclase/mutase family protein [Pirellulaceae bacterium]|nr:terpene cyclase/mutase family protein [Pirellulaceae bacterium]